MQGHTQLCKPRGGAQELAVHEKSDDEDAASENSRIHCVASLLAFTNCKSRWANFLCDACGLTEADGNGLHETVRH